MAPPLKEINWKTFEVLCKLQCTQSEIASSLGIHHETLIRRVEQEFNEPYASVYKKFSEGGKCSLRRFQFQQAEKSCAMAIWLGKQYLGQRDHFEDSNTTPQVINVNLQTEIMKMKDHIKMLTQENDDLKRKAESIN